MLRQRVITAIVAAAILLLVLYVLPEALARLCLAAIFVGAAWEWSGLLGLGSPLVRFVYVGLIGVLQLAAFLLVPASLSYEFVLAIAIAWWLAAFAWTFFYPTPIPAPVGWLGGALVLVPAYVALDWLYGQSSNLLLFMLIIVWAADSGAYFSGRKFGHVKLAPAISPGKTWEGVVGGLLAVLLVAVLRGLWTGNDLAVLVPFCIAVALLSIIGDLTVSMFKRNAGVKDSGTMFPGHGGLLDRIDSVTAAAPLFAAGVALAGLS
ncbi:MAG: phosphatidate cytidylyltransferase [Gammaproteobacteria bacterium]|nr:phosphatidate cytidylyltransferase [Gammaproteobacteria bacterium]MDH4252941.1 phosphatidate cytidylyltransferase [Gammaproteobacteria bacterium]MDH5308373.1 phosphatidate cytidylyltransferase [Gammaproteobacteria bacterium]